jgi:thioredoxin reductase (NADPH)
MNKLTLFGPPDAPELYPLRDFLQRSVVQYDWVDVTADPSALPASLRQMYAAGHRAPAIAFPDGQIVLNPTVQEVAQHLGWISKPSSQEYDLSIYGAGPAGLSAAVYAASEGLRTVLIEREAIGGQAGTSSLIENYMGFPEGIAGAELAERARQQALRFGVDILLLREGIRGTFYDHRIHVDLASGDKLVARANICATGVEYAKLGLPNEAQFFNKGLYYGAGASEAMFCRDKDVFVVGGGNSAGQAASYFAGFARKVYMVIRKGNLAATLSDYLVKRVTTTPNIEILYHATVQELAGDHVLEGIKLVNSEGGTATWHKAGKLFICIGGQPNTEWARDTAIIRDPNGYLITGPDLVDRPGFPACWPLARPPYHLETSVPGSFAAGDVRFNSVKRVASAVGEGAMAVTLVHKYLGELKKVTG